MSITWSPAATKAIEIIIRGCKDILSKEGFDVARLNTIQALEELMSAWDEAADQSSRISVIQKFRTQQTNIKLTHAHLQIIATLALMTAIKEDLGQYLTKDFLLWITQNYTSETLRNDLSKKFKKHDKLYHFIELIYQERFSTPIPPLNFKADGRADLIIELTKLFYEAAKSIKNVKNIVAFNALSIVITPIFNTALTLFKAQENYANFLQSLQLSITTAEFTATVLQQQKEFVAFYQNINPHFQTYINFNTASSEAYNSSLATIANRIKEKNGLELFPFFSINIDKDNSSGLITKDEIDTLKLSSSTGTFQMFDMLLKTEKEALIATLIADENNAELLTPVKSLFADYNAKETETLVKKIEDTINSFLTHYSKTKNLNSFQQQLTGIISLLPEIVALPNDQVFQSYLQQFFAGSISETDKTKFLEHLKKLRITINPDCFTPDNFENTKRELCKLLSLQGAVLTLFKVIQNEILSHEITCHNEKKPQGEYHDHLTAMQSTVIATLNKINYTNDPAFSILVQQHDLEIAELKRIITEMRLASNELKNIGDTLQTTTDLATLEAEFGQLSKKIETLTSTSSNKEIFKKIHGGIPETAIQDLNDQFATLSTQIVKTKADGEKLTQILNSIETLNDNQLEVAQKEFQDLSSNYDSAWPCVKSQFIASLAIEGFSFDTNSKELLSTQLQKIFEDRIKMRNESKNELEFGPFIGHISNTEELPQQEKMGQDEEFSGKPFESDSHIAIKQDQSRKEMKQEIPVIEPGKEEPSKEELVKRIHELEGTVVALIKAQKNLKYFSDLVIHDASFTKSVSNLVNDFEKKLVQFHKSLRDANTLAKLNSIDTLNPLVNDLQHYQKVLSDAKSQGVAIDDEILKNISYDLNTYHLHQYERSQKIIEIENEIKTTCDIYDSIQFKLDPLFKCSTIQEFNKLQYLQIKFEVYELIDKAMLLGTDARRELINNFFTNDEAVPYLPNPNHMCEHLKQKVTAMINERKIELEDRYASMLANEVNTYLSKEKDDISEKFDLMDRLKDFIKIGTCTSLQTFCSKVTNERIRTIFSSSVPQPTKHDWLNRTFSELMSKSGAQEALANTEAEFNRLKSIHGSIFDFGIFNFYNFNLDHQSRSEIKNQKIMFVRHLKSVAKDPTIPLTEKIRIFNTALTTKDNVVNYCRQFFVSETTTHKEVRALAEQHGIKLSR